MKQEQKCAYCSRTFKNKSGLSSHLNNYCAKKHEQCVNYKFDRSYNFEKCNKCGFKRTIYNKIFLSVGWEIVE
jgi:hypothetical protein